MRPMGIIGILLIIAGAAGLIYGGFTFTQKETHDIGGVAEVTTTDKETWGFSPVLGGILLVAGVVVLIASGTSSRGAGRRSSDTP